MPDEELLAHALGQFIAGLMGDDTNWMMVYERQGDSHIGMVSTRPPEELAEKLLELLIHVIKNGTSDLRTHNVKLGEKPS